MGAETARFSAVSGRLAMVGAGLGALALIAVSATLVRETPEAAASVAPEGVETGPVAGAPRVWLAALDLRDAPFAAPDVAMEPGLPRRLAPSRTATPAPVATPGQAATPEPVATTEPVTTPAPAAIPVPVATPEAVASLTPAPVPQVPDAASHQVEVRPHAPRAVPPPRPLLATAPRMLPETLPEALPEALTESAAADLARLRAPDRSPVPPQRPALAQPAPAPAPEALTDQPALLAGIGNGAGLLRSRSPQARPETVTRLASLAVATPAAPVAVEVPALTTGPNTAIARASDSCGAQLTRAIPDRTRGARDGDAVIGGLTGAGGRDRDDAIIAEILAGNVPDFQRNLVPVTFTGTAGNGQPTRITICVTPDYLAVGSNRDFVRVPLGLPAAMRVAERFDMVLPTTLMVDAIYSQAQVRLSPSPMDPTSAMVTTNYFLRHNATVQGQMARAGGQLGQLVSGHKKDLVLTNRLQSNPGRVAIYGWHQRNGQAIQPLSTVHGAQYADYSHGVRLVARRAFVNGRAVDLRDLLSDGRLAALVSSEGTITHRQLLALAD
ncbi:MAG: hypothetical protein ACK4GT_14125 [Pararhodobacter sp.]